MRRPVLVVICDFLVLAALSLIGGGVTGVPGWRLGPLPGGGPTGSEEFQRLDLGAQDQAWEERYGAFDEYLLEESEQRADEADRLRAEAEAEAKRLETERAIAAEQADRLAREKAAAEAEARRLAKEKAATEAKKGEIEKTLATTRDELGGLRTRALELEKEKAAAEAKVGEAERALRGTEEQLGQARARAAEVAARAERTAKEKAAAVARARQAQAELQKRQKELAEAQQEAERLEKEKLVAEARAGQAEKQFEILLKEAQEAKSEGALALAKLSQLAQEKKDLEAQAGDTAAKLQVKQKQLAAAEKKLSRVEQELAVLRQQVALDVSGKGTAWTRPKAWRVLRITMREKDMLKVDSYKAKLSVPIIRVGKDYYAVAEFSSLGLSWYEIVHDGDIIGVEFTLSELGRPQLLRRVEKIHILDGNPQICLIPFPELRGTDAKVYEPVGMDALRRLRELKGIYWFDKNNPDTNGEVSASLSVTGSSMIVNEPRLGRPLPRYRVRRGDYIITRSGQFVGVMTSREKCVVFPRSIKLSRDAIEVPKAKEWGDGLIFETFVRDVKRIWERTNLGSTQ